MAYHDFFVEFDHPERLKDLPTVFDFKGAHVANIPPVEIAPSLWFTLARVNADSRGTAREIIQAAGLRIVGDSWRGVFENYAARDAVFQTNIRHQTGDGESTMRVRLSDLNSFDESVDGIAYPPGVFGGDEVPTFALNPMEPDQRKTVPQKIDQLIHDVSSDNQLSQVQKNKIEKYLVAARALCEQSDTDTVALRMITQRALGYVAKLMLRFGETELLHKLHELLQWLAHLAN